MNQSEPSVSHVLNLITSDWLAVRRASGRREAIAPHQLTDGLTSSDPIVSLDFGRPDLDGAVTEFLIGLVCVAIGPADNACWSDAWNSPPSPDALNQALAPLAFAFDFGGNGPRCFQDLDGLDEAELTPILHLLIDYPGANALRLNTDHFTRRDHRSLSAADAAAALIALQTWAPAGGKGFRTGVRGGGPLTTLARWKRELPVSGSSAIRAAHTLWDTIWLNVPEVPERPALGPALFPWLGKTRTSKNNELTVPNDGVAHELQAFFGTPRRIRLVFDEAGLAAAYRTVVYGVNYPTDAWRHPLTPYYKDANDRVLPVHPRAGPSCYRDWLGVLVNREDAFRARCVNSVSDRLMRIGIKRNDRRADILAFGYDQDKAKARGFVVQSVPWIVAADDKTFGDLMAVGVEAAEATARAVRYAVQMARHGEVSTGEKGETSIDLRDEGKKSAEDVYHAFYSISEPDFRSYLTAVTLLIRFEDGLEARLDFASACRRIAHQLFSAHVDIDNRDIRRTVLAEKWLSVALNVSRAKTYVFRNLQIDFEEAAHG